MPSLGATTLFGSHCKSFCCGPASSTLLPSFGFSSPACLSMVAMPGPSFNCSTMQVRQLPLLGSSRECGRCKLLSCSIRSYDWQQHRSLRVKSHIGQHDAEELIEMNNGGDMHHNLIKAAKMSGDGELKGEGEGNTKSQHQQKNQLLNRFIFGGALGVTGGAVVVAGSWWYTAAIAAMVFTATKEYFALVRSTGISEGMKPPPRTVSRACSVICAAMPLMTLYFGGRVSVAVTSAAFILGIVLLFQREKPRFAQLSSAIFGLFYCGYLPCFWVKLRCSTSIPALSSKIITSIYQRQLTVGLVATIMAISTIIAADTGAFLGGQVFGRTPLSNVSPKKTLEGAFVGLSSSVFVTSVLSKVFCWPPSYLSAAVFAVLIFLGSLFGDLIESMIKRDAGVKDSGRLIPGHGGILDRMDSYVFTGALVYSFVKMVF